MLSFTINIPNKTRRVVGGELKWGWGNDDVGNEMKVCALQLKSLFLNFQFCTKTFFLPFGMENGVKSK